MLGKKEYIGFMKKVGFSCGKSSPCVFWNCNTDVRAVIHGDDFTVSGTREELDKFTEEMRKHFEINVKARIGR